MLRLSERQFATAAQVSAKESPRRLLDDGAMIGRLQNARPEELVAPTRRAVASEDKRGSGTSSGRLFNSEIAREGLASR